MLLLHTTGIDRSRHIPRERKGRDDMPDMGPQPENKQDLRARMSAARRAMSGETAALLARAAQRRILASQLWREAPSVGLYYPVRCELDTQLLLEQGWAEGKTVYLPRSLPGGVMELLPCHERRSLVKGAFGIMEPDPDALPPAAGYGLPDLVVVPALAFDRRGFRLGAGAGYYDRYFAQAATRHITRLGFAYAFQIVPALAAESWDIPMHGVCTEKGLQWMT